MEFSIKKLKKNTWELRLIEPEPTYVNMREDISRALEHATVLGHHDHLVRLICEELLAWDGVMFSRMAYDRWHWYDKPEMDRFVTYFTLKHGN